MRSFYFDGTDGLFASLKPSKYFEPSGFQIQCEDVWFLRQIRQIVARIKADRRNAESGVEVDGSTTDAEIAAEMAKRQRMIESQVRGIGTDVGIVSRLG